MGKKKKEKTEKLSTEKMDFLLYIDKVWSKWIFMADNIQTLGTDLCVKVAQLCLTLCEYSPWTSLGQNTGVGSHSRKSKNFNACFVS